jgi:galactose mutarotase-like enzyme
VQAWAADGAREPVQDLVSLRNAQLHCDIALRGAELRSLRDTDTGEEFIWQRDPAYWVGSAPILFPVIGRLKDGGYTLDGTFHEIPKHGFAREMDFELVTASETSATFKIAGNDATTAAYPFAFLLEVVFTLQGRSLVVDYRVVNRGGRTMPFGLGSHPAFNLPGLLQDWAIVFDATEEPICHRVAENLLSSAPEPFTFSPQNSIELSGSIFDRDALIFKHIRSRKLQLLHRERGVCLEFDTGGAPVLGVWAKPGAPYVCLEPWCGVDDTSETNSDIMQKPGMLKLAPGDSFVTGYRVAV